MIRSFGMRIRFGPFELDDERFQLTRDGIAVALRPKAFDLLAVLVRERARVVRRDELFERLWSTTAVGIGSRPRHLSRSCSYLPVPVSCFMTWHVLRPGPRIERRAPFLSGGW